MIVRVYVCMHAFKLNNDRQVGKGMRMKVGGKHFKHDVNRM